MCCHEPKSSLNLIYVLIKVRVRNQAGNLKHLRCQDHGESTDKVQQVQLERGEEQWQPSPMSTKDFTVTTAGLVPASDFL